MNFYRRQGIMKFAHVLAAGFLFVGVAGSAPVKASTVTDVISFTDSGTYPTNGDPAYPYNPLGVASSSFTITFDPTVTYIDQSLSGVVSGLHYSVTDPFFSPAVLAFNPISAFTYSPGGTLQLFSLANLYGGGALPEGTSDITISVNGFGGPLGSSVYYSQAGFPDTLTINGGATIGTTPLPAALPLFAGGFGILSLIGSRRRKSKKQAPLEIT